MKWKPILGWGLAAIFGLLVLVIVGGLIFLKSNSFKEYAARKISEEVKSSTGASTQVGGMDLNLSGLTARLYDITIHGTEGSQQAPLLHIDELTVGIKIESLLHRKFTLRELLIEHPVVHLNADAHGNINLPQAPASQSKGQTSVFDLAVGHAQITNGEVTYNDKKIPLDADLYDLAADIRFRTLENEYAGSVGYDNGRLQYAQYSSLPHQFLVKFQASPQIFTIESARLRVGNSLAVLRGKISNYSNPVANAQYQVRIHAQDLAEMSTSVRPAGDVSILGKMQYQSSANEPLLRSITTEGQIVSEALDATASGRAINVRNVRGEYHLAGGNFRLTGARLETLGGVITSDAEIDHLDKTPSSHVRAALQGISLRALQQSFHTIELKQATISGALNGTAEASWKGSISNVFARADLTVRASANGRENPSSQEVPVDGAVHAIYDAPRGLLSLNNTSMRVPSAVLNAQGTVSNHSDLQVQITAKDLHQLVDLASSFTASENHRAVSGSAVLSAVVRGSLASPVVTGNLSAQNLEVEGSAWKSANLDLLADASQIAVNNAKLVNASKGQVSFDAKIGLRKWIYQPSNPVEAHLSVSQLEVRELQRLASQHYPVSGELSAQLTLRGSQLDPRGSGSAQIINARAYDEPIQTLKVQLEAANGTVSSTLNLASPAGGLTANVAYTPKTRAYKLRLDAPGVTLEKIRILQERNMPISGRLTANASGQGTLDNPQLTAVVEAPQLNVQQHSLDGLKAEVRVADQNADLNLSSNVASVGIKGHARVRLDSGYYTEAALDTTTIPLSLLMAASAHAAPAGFQGETEFHATMKGPLQDKSKIEAHLSIPKLTASYQSLQLAIAQALRADYANSVVTIQPVEFRGTGTSLRLQGSVPLRGNVAPDLTAQGSVDIRILRLVVPDSQSSGQLAINLHASGSSSNPSVEGRVQIKDVALATSDAPIGVENLNGVLNVDSSRVQIANMTGQMGGGKVSLGGSIAYRPSLQFNLAVNGQSIRLHYPEGLRTLLDANLALTGSTEASTLNGRVLIDSLSFSPDFDLAKFGDQFSTGTSTPTQPGFADTVKLAINVQSKENLNATSSQVSIAGRANLEIVGTAGEPVITGRTNLSSGELFYRGLRYELQRGVITFDDPNQTHAVLNVSVGTKVEQYNLTITMRGPLDKLTTSYVSDPPLATADVINLIARGKTVQESNASSQSTDSMVASQAASQLSSRVQKLAGLSSLQIDPLIGGNNQNLSARVGIQQRVTKNLFFTFSTDVSQPGSEIVEGDYQINKRWSVSVTRDQLGGVSVDGKFHKRF